MTGLLIGLAVIAGWIVLSALLVALMAGIDRAWKRLTMRIWGQQ